MEGHDFVGCSKPAPSEPTVPAPKMTVDELLAKLDAEYDMLKSALPQAYEGLGRASHRKLKQTTDGVYPSDLTYEFRQVDTKETRMSHIRALQTQIRLEEGS